MKIKLYMCTSVLEKNSTYSKYLYGSVFRILFDFFVGLTIDDDIKKDDILTTSPTF